jgi:hypothetical protein
MTQNLVIRHKSWSYDTNFGCTTQNLVVCTTQIEGHLFVLYDTNSKVVFRLNRLLGLGQIRAWDDRANDGIHVE